MEIKFKTMWNSVPDKGEINSGDLVTEPGQTFTTREIYERFLTTGRVMSEARVVYDEDEIGREPTYDDYDVTQDGAFDLSDASNHKEYLTNKQTQRQNIERLAVAYSSGNLSFDEFARLANEQSPEYASRYIQKFGEQLSKQKPKDD